MNRLKAILRNLRLLFTRELLAVFAAQEQKLDQRIDALEQRTGERADALEQRTGERIDALEQRTGERADALEQRTGERVGAFEQGIGERADSYERALDARADSYERALDARLDERFGAIEQRLDDWQAVQEQRADERAGNYEASLDARFEERFVILEQRNDERLSAIEQHNDAQFAAIEQHNDAQFAAIQQRNDERQAELDQRFDDRTRAVDNRLDDRFAHTERQIDERFEALENRADTRMETHEKRTDYNLKLNRADIIDRTDVMLQIFEQHLDQRRREIRALREQIAGSSTPAAPKRGAKRAANGRHAAPRAVEPQQILAETEPAQQVQSFRKLAQSSGLIGKTRLPLTDATLYQKILDWKKVAADKLNEFTPDEQEVVSYILSFIHDANERDYTVQHLRRLVATLQRIPPPQRSTDRLLELGSLLHLAPAFKKFCGYQEIHGADFWESAEKVSQETLQPAGGNESHTFELRNFNVEADPFPYPDGHFRVVLCCELLEHLQRDPLHMLWECNRVLLDDGFLLLTTPNITSARSLEGVLIGCAPYLLSQYNRNTPVDQHNREYAPYEVGLALAAAGFSVIELETEDVWLRSNPAILKLLEEVNLPTHLRGDNIFALARKTGAPIERYPKEFYIE